MCPDSVGSERDRETRAELDALKARIKREALALFVGFYFDGKGLDVHRAVKLGDITRAGESLRAALNERKEA
jgi:hypothetical protein